MGSYGWSTHRVLRRGKGREVLLNLISCHFQEEDLSVSIAHGGIEGPLGEFLPAVVSQFVTSPALWPMESAVFGWKKPIPQMGRFYH